MAAVTQHQIVILGGNMGGLGVTHFLLRNTLPALLKLTSTYKFHITLVTPNSSFYFKPASPRAAIQPALLSPDRLWAPLDEALSQYSQEQITLLKGLATELNPLTRHVSITTNLPSNPQDTKQYLQYDTLVIATGTTSSSPLWTLHADPDLTPQAITSLQATLPIANTVLIAGGGPVGVETAGEIATAYPSVEVTLLSGSGNLLTRCKPELGNRAQTYLEENLGVKVVHSVRVAKVDLTSEESEDRKSTIVTLNDGTTKWVDLYVDATGGIPNSQFLPATWLDDSQRVKTRHRFFRVKGSGAGTDATDTYVIGDIVANSANSLLELDPMITTVCSSIGVDIAAKLGIDKSGPRVPFAGLFRGVSPAIAQKEFKPMRNTIIVPMGLEGGVSMLMGWKMPNFFTKLAKGKSFLIEMMPPMISGKKYKA